MNYQKEINIDRNMDEFIYIQLFREISKLIDSGKLSAYDKLPPIRVMSSKLDLNTATVVGAYKLLEEAGLVHKKVGSGTFVSPRVLDDEDDIKSEEGLINFASTTPPIDLFPVEDFKAAMNEVIDRDGGDCFGYQEGKGYSHLRENFRKRLFKKGISVDMSQIQIISGVQQGIDIVSKAILNQGDTVIVESPTYAGAIGSFRLRGANIVELPIESSGDVEDFIIHHKPKLIYMIPNFQNPSGNTYSGNFKIKLAQLAHKYNFYIIEDDFATDLAFNVIEPICIKNVDEFDKVIYLKSFSKLFMPGLRIGFMLVPKNLEEIISYAKHTSDISTSGFMQRAFENYLWSGRFDSQFGNVFKTLKERFTIAADIIGEGNFTQTGLNCMIPDGGVNFWFELSEEIDDILFFRLLDENGIKIVKGDAFFTKRQSKAYFRLSVAGLKNQEIEFGLRQIYKLAKKAKRNTRASIDNNIPI